MTAGVLRTLIAAGASPGIGLLVKATLVATLGLAGAGLARRRSAASRHLILAGALAGLLLLPLATFVVPAVRLAIPIAPASAESAPATFAAISAGEPAGDGPSEIATEETGLAAPGSWWRRLTVSEIAFSIWALGTAAFLLTFLAGFGDLRRLRRAAAGARPRRESGRVRLLLHGDAGPMTFGAMRPVIVLPSSARDWPAADVERALTHELEHIRRGDWFTFCAARWVCALYWFHPLAWMLLHRMNLEAERACDDAVLRGADALDYANQLVGFAEQRAAALRTPLLALAGRTDLAKRIGAMLDKRQRRGRVGWPAAVLAATAVALLTFTVSPLRVAASADAPGGSGQTAQDRSAVRFTVVSLREWKPGQMPQRYAGVRRQDPGRVFAEYATLSQMLAYAFHLLGTERVEGAPSWAGFPYARAGAGVIHFALDARMPASTTNAQARLMMQSLLRERFKLAWHSTTERTKVLELVVAPGGLKVKLSNPATDPELPANGKIFSCGNVSACSILAPGPKTMSAIAGSLSGSFLRLGRPVVDKTGLAGRFFVPEMVFIPPGETSTAVPNIPTELREVAGLKLRPGTDAIPVLVIDHVEKMGADPGGDPPPAPAPHFDVASIQAWGPHDHMPDHFVVGVVLSPGRLLAQCAGLKMLVMFAYKLTGAEPIEGMPKWATAVCPAGGTGATNAYMVQATMPASTTRDQARLMMQSLLAERFQFAAHWETRQMAILALVTAKGGLKIKPSDPAGDQRPPRHSLGCPADSPGCQIICCGSRTMADMAGLLTSELGRPVIDRTGASGSYLFGPYGAIRWRGPEDAHSSLPSLPALLRDQFGLRLEPQRGPVRVLAITHVGRPLPN